MIHADLDKILPEADALEKITSIIEEVETNQELFIITKSGRPACAIINIDYLEELTGSQVSTQGSKINTEIKPEPELIEKAEDQEKPDTVLSENSQDDEPILQEEVPATQTSPSFASPPPPFASTPSSPVSPPLPTETAAQTPPSFSQTPPPIASSTPAPETPPQSTSTTTVSQSDDNLPPEDSNSGSPMS